MLRNMKLFLVLNRISHSFTLRTREISWSTLEINFIFPHIHVLLSICYSVPDAMGSLGVVVPPKKTVLQEMKTLDWSVETLDHEQ